MLIAFLIDMTELFARDESLVTAAQKLKILLFQCTLPFSQNPQKVIKEAKSDAFKIEFTWKWYVISQERLQSFTTK